MAGGLKSGGLTNIKSDGLMSGGLMSHDRI